jgi:hypothetical protein
MAMDGANMTIRHAVYRAATTAATIGLSGLVIGCAHLRVDPLEVKPITINVNVRVQQQLDQFFSFEDKLLTGDTTRPATAPATTTVPPPHSEAAH